jgi:hypothetical protein
VCAPSGSGDPPLQVSWGSSVAGFAPALHWKARAEHDDVAALSHVHAAVCGPVEGVQQKSESPLAATTGELHSSVTPSTPYGNDPGTHEYDCPEHAVFVVDEQPGAAFP